VLGAVSSKWQSDLAQAKDKLFEGEFSLVVVKNGTVLFESKSHGVSDTLRMIDTLGERAQGASVADKIVGKAGALLCVYSGIKAIYGSIMSEGAVSLLNERGVHCEFGTVVPKILNRKGDDICPFDKAVTGIVDPTIAVQKLRSVRM
jgi:hypothetical protein